MLGACISAAFYVTEMWKLIHGENYLFQQKFWNIHGPLVIPMQSECVYRVTPYSNRSSTVFEIDISHKMTLHFFKKYVPFDLLIIVCHKMHYKFRSLWWFDDISGCSWHSSILVHISKLKPQSKLMKDKHQRKWLLTLQICTMHLMLWFHNPAPMQRTWTYLTQLYKLIISKKALTLQLFW